ncbi:hypothetical protein FJY93_00260 [Candidatus Kaiserbacteria bacterium]|nr:hypothetical protein [Candidatus Kaiserbacteria bacterium]
MNPLRNFEEHTQPDQNPTEKVRERLSNEVSADIISTVKELLNAAGIEYSDVSENELAGQIIYSISTKNLNQGPYGFQADVAHAIDFLVKKITEKRTASAAGSEKVEDHARNLFLVDINDQRTKHIKDLQSKALIMAERARSFQYDVELSPMSAYERLIIHATLSGASNVKTESQGEGRNRRVVIRYAA